MTDVLLLEYVLFFVHSYSTLIFKTKYFINKWSQLFQTTVVGIICVLT